ncbi:MAG TPA: DinB family protein [Sphingomonadales bacterium]|nr:DinB family protein [Sphingomonadales bacterium]
MKTLKNVLLVCFVVLAVAASAHAQTAQADREAMLAHLQKTQKALDDATKGLSPAQWNFKPAPDRWSIAEAYEHITLGESMLFDMIQKGVSAPATPEKKVAAAAEKDAQVQTMIADRSRKFQAPEPLQPTGRWSLDEMKKEFTARRGKSIEFVKTAPQDLRAHVMAGPAGELDAVQWIYCLSAHAERHTAQILEVKADPNFPKK